MFSFFKQYKSLRVDCFERVYCLPLERQKSESFRFFGGVYSSAFQFIEQSSEKMNGKRIIDSYDKNHVKEKIVANPTKILNSAIYLGILHNHFGHFICDTLSRLWAISDFDEDMPIVCLTFDGGVPKFAHDFFRLAGLNDRIIYIDRAIYIKSLVIPEKSVEYPNFFHPAYLKIRKLIFNNNHFSSNTTDQLLFVSRENLTLGYSRYVVGEGRIASALVQCGASAISPESLDLMRQFSVFNKHRTIVGYAGSAMHNLLYTNGRKKNFYYSARPIPKIYRAIDSRLINDSRYLCAGQDPSSDVIKLKVGFKPEIIDVEKVLRGLEVFLQCSIPLDNTQPSDYQRQMILEYNTAMIIRYIVEQKAMGKKSLESVFLKYNDEYRFDVDMISRAASMSPVLKSFFFGLRYID